MGRSYESSINFKKEARKEMKLCRENCSGSRWWKTFIVPILQCACSAPECSEPRGTQTEQCPSVLWEECLVLLHSDSWAWPRFDYYQVDMACLPRLALPREGRGRKSGTNKSPCFPNRWFHQWISCLSECVEWYSKCSPNYSKCTGPIHGPRTLNYFWLG